MPNRRHRAFGSGWYWRAGQEEWVLTPEQLFEAYISSVGRNTNLLLGMGISTDGDFKDEEQFRIYRSNCVGHKRIIPLEPLGINDAGAITFRVTESAGEAKLRDVGIY